MLLSSAITAATALFASVGFAAPTVRAPAEVLFNLTVTSTSSQKYTGALLGAAHSGAAIEALAVTGYSTSFSFNETDLAASGTNSPPGYLVYILPSQPESTKQQLNFYKNDTSNVQAGFFGIGSGPILFTFTESGELFHYDGEGAADSYFYVCSQTSEAYTYETLSYVAEGSAPDNADCDAVTVQKVEL